MFWPGEKDQSAHAFLMELYARLGRTAQALKQYKEYVQAWARQGDVKPDKSLRKLYLDLKAKRLMDFPPLNRKRAGHRPQQQTFSPVPGLPEARFHGSGTVRLKK